MSRVSVVNVVNVPVVFPDSDPTVVFTIVPPVRVLVPFTIRFPLLPIVISPDVPISRSAVV